MEIFKELEGNKFTFKTIEEAVNFFISGVLNKIPFYELENLYLNDPLRLLHSRGFYQLSGDSFLHEGKVILFCGDEHYTNTFCSDTDLKNDPDIIPFSDVYSWLSLQKGEKPLIFNTVNKLPTTMKNAPLDLIVHLVDPEDERETNARIVQPSKDDIVTDLLPHYPDTMYLNRIRKIIMSMLNQVKLLGYMPVVEEDPVDTYKNVLRYVKGYS